MSEQLRPDDTVARDAQRATEAVSHRRLRVDPEEVEGRRQDVLG
jgi:hypothetical protein